jgi:hypothetical protein
MPSSRYRSTRRLLPAVDEVGRETIRAQSAIADPLTVSVPRYVADVHRRTFVSGSTVIRPQRHRCAPAAVDIYEVIAQIKEYPRMYFLMQEDIGGRYDG